MKTEKEIPVADQLDLSDNLDDYDAAFNNAADDLPVQEIVVEGAQGVDGELPSSGSAVVGDETPPLAVVEEPEVTTPPAPVAADVALTNRIAELEASLIEQTKPAAVAPTSPEPAVLSDVDQEVISEVEEDWPTINRALEIKISQLEGRLSQLITGKLGEVQQQIAPLAKNSNESAQDKFMVTIRSAHEDADALLPRVEQWIEAQPSYLRPAMNNVLDRGTAAQVIELFTNYKLAAGEAPAVAATVVDTGTERRLAGMEGVRTQRTGVSADDDPSDFASAFESAASTH
jgi:hypothetical protein